MFSERKKIYFFIVASVLVFVAAVAYKLVYIETAESRYNIEELPLAAIGLVGDRVSIADVAATRLYGTQNITTALSIKTFGFNVFGIKVPNILFFFMSVLFLFLFVKRFFGAEGRWYALMCSSLLVFGPPVAQMWGMKNRGGFIENIFALVICLWICSGVKSRGFKSSEIFVVAIVVGLATWSQPVGIVWGVCVLAYIFIWNLRYQKAFELAKLSVIQFSGVALGVLPLIVLNVYFNLNTLNFFAGGEPFNAGCDSWCRAQQVVLGGIPRILGLKEQWDDAWILPLPLALTVYVFFLVPVVLGGYKVIATSVKSRELNVGTLVVVVCLAVLVANIMTSWGNFQLEPRRLLILYVPYAILAVIGVREYGKLAVFYISVWVVFNFWSNSSYIRKHLDGFSNHVYRSMEVVADFLVKEGVHGIYTDVWTGGRVTFESKGRIPWFRSPYVPTAYGYVGNGKFDYKTAMVFDNNFESGAKGKERFMRDLNKSNISCRESDFDTYSIIYKCNIDFRFEDIIFAPGNPGEVAVERVAEEISTQVGKKEAGKLIANKARGSILFGPYVAMPKGNYSVEVYGSSTKSFIFDIVSDGAEREYLKMDKNGAQGEGVLLVQDFYLPHRVNDFEVRIRIAEDSDMEISGYKIFYR